MLHVESLHFIEPFWNEANLVQAVFRGIRLPSHYEENESCIWRDPELYIFQLCPEPISRLIQHHLRQPEIPIKQIAKKLYLYPKPVYLEIGRVLIPDRHVWSYPSIPRMSRIGRDLSEIIIDKDKLT